MLLQQLHRIGHAAGAFAEDHSCSDAFQKFALRGTVPLLELGHDLPHPLSRRCPILGRQAQDNASPDQCAASAFHGAHACSEGIAQVTGGLFVKANQVGVCANNGLRAIVRAATQFLRCYVFSGFHDNRL